MTDYTLSRRDALAALAAAGVATGGLGALAWESLDEESPLSTHDRETLVAIARAVYPQDIEGIPEFVASYVTGRVSDRPERARNVAHAIETLDEYARTMEGSAYVDLPATRQEATLEAMGVDVVDPDPEGTKPARLRYYLVNELLFALYASPTGGRLVGIENPQGHPGGLGSYQRDPP
ncbi:MAG: hypothetical protein ACI8XM_002721 [Haloarculaceae archaeon]|jgi:hypothetical protein